ncbi:MAG: hypothetical protein IKQ25_03675 [Lachnospiraceae bacterium]|nr:hypothetical protein [Lachnospiraceae bacterium]
MKGMRTIKPSMEVRMPEGYNMTLREIEFIHDRLKNDDVINVICDVFAFGFEVGARATKRGKYDPKT